MTKQQNKKDSNQIAKSIIDAIDERFGNTSPSPAPKKKGKSHPKKKKK